MNTDINNASLHKEFQSWYKLKFPDRTCRLQNLLGTYTTVHAENAFLLYCENLEEQ